MFVRFSAVLELQRFKLLAAKFERVRQPFPNKHSSGVRADCLVD
jgi:hypothetical protein